LGVGVGVGVGPGVGLGVGDAVGVGLGVGVPTAILGMGTVRTDDVGVWVGWVGSSSVIVWHPTRTSATATPWTVFIAAPSLEFT
jgi:hypothetical protein